jgi:hypothetical protein
MTPRDWIVPVVLGLGISMVIGYILTLLMGGL